MPKNQHSNSRALRREQADARNTARANRSDYEQLDLLVARGAYHCKEAVLLRVRLGLVDAALR